MYDDNATSRNEVSEVNEKFGRTRITKARSSKRNQKGKGHEISTTDYGGGSES